MDGIKTIRKYPYLSSRLTRQARAKLIKSFPSMLLRADSPIWSLWEEI
ncbi:unknown [Clostridium sp. CAG:149]|nr:unknown [Clostridium sp. CAG:149]